MAVDKRIIEKNLLKKGFEKEESHHTYFYYKPEGKYTGISTYISHGSHYKTYPDGLINQMKKQLKLDSKHQTEDLFNCPLSKDEYFSILKGKGLL